MFYVSIAEAGPQFAHLIEEARKGEEITITDNEQVIARLVPAETEQLSPRKPGSAKGKILYIAEDFDAPLEDFAEYQ